MTGKFTPPDFTATTTLITTASNIKNCSRNCAYEKWLPFVLTHLLTYSMEQSPSWEANRFSASQEIPHILWISKIHYLVYKCPPTVPILSQIDPVHTPSSYFLNIYLNIILPSTPGSIQMVSFHQSSPPKPCIHLSSPHTCYMPRQSRFRFYHPNNIWWEVQIIKLLIM